MCGIAGYVERHDRARREIVDAQLTTVAHRGPDASGVFAVGRGAVGQNRLSVIDLETGDPPITNEDGTIGVAFNGEIYNFRELRARLIADGHRFATNGDTEVLAHLAEDLPPAEVARAIVGMAAFAIWDSRREQLVLGRDRLGKKPLYYRHSESCFVFGSEIKAVLAHPDVPHSIDLSVVPDYLTFGAVPTPGTFFEGIKSLPPGHVATVDRELEMTFERYWAAPTPGVDGIGHHDLSFDEAAREVRERLSAAVDRRRIADVPLGAFLSGGIDSSAVVASLAELSDRPVKTFTIGFDAAGGFDERREAQLVAERFGTEHTEFVVEPDAVDLVERLVWHHDQPFGDSSAIPTFLLSELTRQHVTVALAGDGGDECFAGYERFAAGVLSDRVLSLPLGRPALRVLASTLRRGARSGLVGRFERFSERAALGLPDAYRAWLDFVPTEVRRALVADGDGPGIAAYRDLWYETEGAATLDRLLDLNLRTYLLDDLLPKVDRMAMAHALEVRSPFLDHELVEFALRLPPSMKVRGLATKRVLKHAMRGVLPDSIIDRRKHGFGVPLDEWFRGSLRNYLHSMLGPGASVRNVLHGDAIDTLLADEDAARRNHGHALWTLLTLEVFLRAHR